MPGSGLWAHSNTVRGKEHSSPRHLGKLMKNITIALLIGLSASTLSYAVLNTNLALSFFLNPFIPYYFNFDTTNESLFWPAIIVGLINMIPFFVLASCQYTC